MSLRDPSLLLQVFLLLTFFISTALSYPQSISPPTLSQTIRNSANVFNNGSRLLFSSVSTGIRTTSQIIINQRDRQQCSMHRSLEFPCRNLRPSSTVPSSVHHLRPGDIKVIGALGDSITAGTGALADNLFQLLWEYRGVSFSAGGLGTWREYLTVPNILKNFNPKLYGFSTGTNKVRNEKNIDYNMARSGATSKDLLRQVHLLIEKIKRDPHIDYGKDWKMITIFIGHNDVCSHTCQRHPKFHDSEFVSSPEVYISFIRKALDTLQKELPRTFVSIMPMADVSLSLDIVEKPIPCDFTFFYLCPCLFDPFFSNTFSKKEMMALERKYLYELEKLVSSGRYDIKPDFTVVIQPSIVEGDVPRSKTRRGVLQPNLDYLAPDCFHFSQKLHAMVSRALWNNLLEPVGLKRRNYRPDTPFLCPTEIHPYLATNVNSRNSTMSTSDMMQDFMEQIGNEPGRMNCPL
ncbi:phospholipase B1, membrane-associated [Lepeophtheirus salmonis]|uniref:phospholipase B1, membrane-associated n=1 Tax=Lepeophtheirus salmonis TaxID=72036 RepID=UPI001AE1DE5E|nr:phospholipase B1, membrane-associated-like [Lepeophtheirus salmonis]